MTRTRYASVRQRRTPVAKPAPRAVTVEAHAKLNLGLAVGPRRADGFHDLVTVFQSISLHDTLTVTRAARGFTLRVRHERAEVRGRTPRASQRAVPAGADNLVLRAARLVAKRFELPGGARFTLTKRIPAEAGMGGGSADAAAAIMGLLALHRRRPSEELCKASALELGSDVPFALHGGTTLGSGRGEVLRSLRLRSPFHAVIAMPAWRVSTRLAFARLDRVRNSLTPWEHHLRFARTLGRQQVEALALIRRGNRFEAVLGRRRRDLDSLCARLRAAGLLEPHLTGSGSAVFAIVPHGAKVREIVGRFLGDEPLFTVRSVGRSLRLHVHAAAARPGKGSRAGAPPKTGARGRRRTRAS
jgi:4-diphosphocytidyl-2C-methyl-D-erythritol kinase